MSPIKAAVFHLRTSREDHPEFQQILDQLTDSTIAAATAQQWITHEVPSAEIPLAESIKAAEDADVIIILGGEDVDPRFYNADPDYPGASVHEAHADTAHIAVIQKAISTNTPLLGICRGAQLINVALGGTLIQDMEGHRAAGSISHSFAQVSLPVSTNFAFINDIAATEPVLCTHHQAIGEIGADLIVAATAADGIIEAIVHNSAPITGVQFHPEHPDTRAQLNLLLNRLESQLNSAQSGVTVLS